MNKKIIIFVLVFVLVMSFSYAQTLSGTAEQNIIEKSDYIAKQVEIYIKSNPQKTVLDLKNDSYFKEIALQQIGDYGYTVLYDYDSMVNILHYNPEYEGVDYNILKETSPSFWEIAKKTIGGVSDAKGYYDWIEPDGEIRKKFMYNKIIPVKTAEGVGLAIAITAYVDEYSSKELKSATELDYPPFSTPTSKDDIADGFSVELLKAALDSQGYNVSFYVDEWSIIKQDLADGKIDVLPLVGRTPEREDIYDFTVPYVTLKGAVFIRKGETGISSITDLKDKEILVMKGDNAEEYALRKNLSSKIIATDTFEQAFGLLSMGEHDAIITQELVGQQLMAKLGISNIEKKFLLDDFRQDFTFAVKKGDKEILFILNNGLSKIISDGTFDSIYDRWLGELLEQEKTRSALGLSLEKNSEDSITQKARQTAKDIDEYLKKYPEKTIEDLQQDLYFKQIAVQRIGKEGYTAVIDSNTGYFYFHPQKNLENTDSHILKNELPEWWGIFEKALGEECNEVSGYYDWKESDGKITEKFMHTSCVETKTSDNKTLFVSATTYLDKNIGEEYLEKYDVYNLDNVKQRIKQKAVDVAKQIEIYIKLNPGMTVEDLQKDHYFKEIAVQKVDESGYTTVMDADSLVNYFHKNEFFIGIDYNSYRESRSSFFDILENAKGCKDSGGIYEWIEPDNTTSYKYAYYTCANIQTSEGIRLRVGATTYLDEYQPTEEKEDFSAAKKAIRTQAENVAKQIKIYIQLNPKATVEDLQNDPYFQEIAVQRVGKTGYTAVSDYDKLIARFHENPAIVDLELSTLSEKLPGFWDIMRRTKGGYEAEGIYDWEENDGSIRKKYMYIAIVDAKTADNIGLHVAATTYLDEYEEKTSEISEKMNFRENIFHNLGYSILVVLLILLSIFFFGQNFLEKYKGLKTNFKLINLFSIVFIISFFIETMFLDPIIRLYASRAVLLTSLFLVLSLSIICLIVSLKKPIKTRYYFFAYLFFIFLGSLILFTPYFEKQVIIDLDKPLISNSVFGGLYFIYPLIMILILIMPVYFLIKNYIISKSRLLLHFIFVYLALISLIIFDVIFFAVLNLDLNILLMLTPTVINIGVYIIFLKNNLLQEQDTNKILRILFFASLIITCIFLANTWNTTKDIKDNELKHISNSLNTIAISRQKHIETYLEQNVERFKLITSRNKLRELIRSYNKDKNQEYIDAITEIIIDAKEPINEFERICVLNIDGEVIASTDQDFVGKNIIEKGFFVSGLIQEKVFFVEEEGIPKLLVSGPFIVDDEVIGVGITVVSTEYLNNILAERTGFDEDEELYLIDETGYMITPSRFIDDSVLTIKVDTFNSRDCNFKKNISGQSSDYDSEKVLIGKDYRNITVVGANVYMRDRGWCLLAEQNYDSTNSIVEKSIRNIWFFTFGVIFSLLILSLLFGFFITRTLRLKIKQKTLEITNINKNLEKTINERTRELEELTKELEKKVEQRTSDLTEKVQELEKFQKLTVGRELRMIELKKQLNQLQKKVKKR